MWKNPESMIASFVVGPGKIVTCRTPRPGPGDGLLLKTLYCGVCGSDRRQLASAKVGEKKIIGHEIVGEIVGTSRSLGEWAGKQVGIAPRVGCGSCVPCMRGRPNICERLRVFGYQLPGGFAQFVAIPEEAVSKGNVIQLPPGLDPRTACLAEPLSCVLNGIELSRIEREEPVLVLGAGPMGQMFVIMASRLTKEVYVVEPDTRRREFSLAHGARDAFASEAADIPSPEVTIVACSDPKAYDLALRVTAPGGTVNLFGGLAEGMKVDSNYVHYRQLRLHGTAGSTPAQFAQALEALRDNPKLADIITDVISFRNLPKALSSDAASGRLSLKTLLDPWRR